MLGTTAAINYGYTDLFAHGVKLYPAGYSDFLVRPINATIMSSTLTPRWHTPYTA